MSRARQRTSDRLAAAGQPHHDEGLAPTDLEGDVAHADGVTGGGLDLGAGRSALGELDGRVRVTVPEHLPHAADADHRRVVVGGGCGGRHRRECAGARRCVRHRRPPGSPPIGRQYRAAAAGRRPCLGLSGRPPRATLTSGVRRHLRRRRRGSDDSKPRPEEGTPWSAGGSCRSCPEWRPGPSRRAPGASTSSPPAGDRAPGRAHRRATRPAPAPRRSCSCRTPGQRRPSTSPSPRRSSRTTSATRSRSRRSTRTRCGPASPAATSTRASSCGRRASVPTSRSTSTTARWRRRASSAWSARSGGSCPTT